MNLQMSVQILLADDDEDDTFLFQEALSQISVDVDLTTAHNGKELMNSLMVRDTAPDLIFLDMNMPVKNGLECLSEIRENEKFALTPVVIMSTSVAQSLIDSTFKGGAKLYIQKPTSFSSLVTLIENCILKRSEFIKTPTLEQFLIGHRSNQ